MLLSLPALWQGLRIDDYHHDAAIRGATTGVRRGDLAHMYSFLDGRPERTQRLVDAGHAPWWTDPKAKLAFFRPLTAFTQRLDYALWPDRPAMMHAHSLVWLVAAVLAAGAFYRTLFGATAVAGLALLLFAIDDAHATPATRLAQRSTLLAVFFGVLALVSHHPWRALGWRPGALAGPALFALALLSGEPGVIPLAYLAAYTLCCESQRWTSRLVALLPYAVLAGVWRFALQAAGFGAANIDFYIDPVAAPLNFLGALAFRLPILFLGLFTPLPSSGALMGPPGAAARMFGAGIAAIVVMAALTWPYLKRDALMRYFALGTLLSLGVSCTAHPHNRALMWSGLGAMGLLARLLTEILARDALPWASRVHRAAASLLALALAIVHLIVAPVQRPLAILRSGALQSQLCIPALDDPALTRDTVVVVNGPPVFHASHFAVMQSASGLPAPKHVRILAPSFAAVELERLDERTLAIRPTGGWLQHPLDGLYRSRRRPLSVGERVQLSGVAIEVTALTADGRPAAVVCRFEKTLEVSSLRWIYWENGRYRRWTPPDILGKVSLPPAAPAT